MSVLRTIDSIRITISRDSVADVKIEKYIDRLLTEVYELPGIVLETEIDIDPGDATTYHAVINGDTANTNAMTEELMAVSEKVLRDIRKGKQ